MAGLVLILPQGDATAGQTPTTICTGRSEVIRIFPGLSMKPTTGTGDTVVAGKVRCTGPLEGHVPTGTITTRHFFTYGYQGADTCSDIEIEGWVDYSVPTANGVVVLRNHFTETVKPLSDPAHAFAFQGDRFSGRAFIQAADGDCVTTPITRIEVGWVGRWHGRRSSPPAGVT